MLDIIYTHECGRKSLKGQPKKKSSFSQISHKMIEKCLKHFSKWNQTVNPIYTDLLRNSFSIKQV
jgi:hypothetical protein